MTSIDGWNGAAGEGTRGGEVVKLAQPVEIEAAGETQCCAYEHEGRGVLDLLMDFLINELFYKIGFAFLVFITGGRFKGESSYYYSLVCLVGFLLVLSTVVLIFLAWVMWF
ncbi:hypothetical protein [Pseudomonas bijieensis]|uniref:hypothetical protein n=1 Tax=Pseudomonas bijieensis TaxID=2681983 RepID=UPI001E3C9F94|nr:hypothetical protein [Pseudomonas bijieensis]MCD9118467.1 hypothetical protein [Pseudomonas bijieensis]